jgi:uncharacterized membrane protein YqjE
MEPATVGVGHLIETSKRLARRLLTMGENRLELLLVEVQEERERLLRVILLALGVAAFGLLAGITLTAAIVVLLWPCSHAAALLTLTGVYAVAAICFYWRLVRILRRWENLPATLDQLKKDRACLEKNLM